MIRDFKQFLLRGNVVDLAVGIVIGGAFGAVVTALVLGVTWALVHGRPIDAVTLRTGDEVQIGKFRLVFYAGVAKTTTGPEHVE